MNFRKPFCATLVLGALYGAPTLADSSYPGTLCHPEDPNSRPQIVREDQGIFRDGASGQTPSISCPILRDFTSDVDGLRQLRIYVRGPVECTLNTRDGQGSLGGSGSRDTVTYGGTGNTTLYLSTSRSYAGGPYQFQCLLRGDGAGITGYFVQE